MPRIIPPDALETSLARRADLCVKCGLCLPHCPTYRVTQDEGDSPRGRIALMQGLAGGALAQGAALERHLDGCLTCRACEAVCPAGVPYGALIDDARVLLARHRPERHRLARTLAAVLAQATLRRLAAALLWLYQRSGLSWLLRRGGLLGHGRLARAESLLPPVHWPRLPVAAPRAGAAKVALFATCTGPLVEPETLDAAVRVLSRAGCDVAVPAGQGCCGALHQHAGSAAAARACAERNLEAFAGAEAVVGIASGCTAQLLDYARIEPGPAALAFSPKVRDVVAFVAEHPGLAPLAFEPLRARVLVHTPCTLRNVVKAPGATRALLSRIPGLTLLDMDGGCCGAAGSAMLDQPQMADTLLQPALAQIAAARPDYVVSANVGCALHLAAGLRRVGLTVPVWHPVRLLARQLSG